MNTDRKPVNPPVPGSQGDLIQQLYAEGYDSSFVHHFLGIWNLNSIIIRDPDHDGLAEEIIRQKNLKSAFEHLRTLKHNKMYEEKHNPIATKRDYDGPLRESEPMHKEPVRQLSEKEVQIDEMVASVVSELVHSYPDAHLQARFMKQVKNRLMSHYNDKVEQLNKEAAFHSQNLEIISYDNA